MKHYDQDQKLSSLHAKGMQILEWKEEFNIVKLFQALTCQL